MPLATVFVEIFSKEKNWRGFRPYLVTPLKEFEISLKNGVLKIFERVNRPGQFSGPWLNLYSKYTKEKYANVSDICTEYSSFKALIH